MIGSSILRNSDRKFLDSYSRCSLRLFSCKTTKATANIYFQRFEVGMNKRKPFLLFERELALLVALQGKSSWKGGAGHGDVHWKDAITVSVTVDLF